MTDIDKQNARALYGALSELVRGLRAFKAKGFAVDEAQLLLEALADEYGDAVGPR